MTSPSPTFPATPAQAAKALLEGCLVVLPTETVYGLGALATDPVAVRRIFAAKGRPVDHPLIVHLADAAALDSWATNVPDYARLLTSAIWPGPLTLVCNRRPSVLDEVTGGQATVAVRVPNHPLTLSILQSLPIGSGIAAPSANRFGQVSPTTADAAFEDLRAYLRPGDLVVDGGPCEIGVESTILDVTSSTPTILRPGGLEVEKIEELLGRSVERVASGPPRAPGMLTAHYAPRASVRLVEAAGIHTVFAELGGGGLTVGFLGPREWEIPPQVRRLATSAFYDGKHLAPILYERLRDADRLGIDVLVIVAPDESGLGWAVADRMRRAATSAKEPKQVE